MAGYPSEKELMEERKYFQKAYLKESVEWIKYLIALSTLQAAAMITIGEKLFADRTEYRWILVAAVAAFVVVAISGVLAYTGILCFYDRISQYFQTCLYKSKHHSESEAPRLPSEPPPPPYIEPARQMQIHSFFAAMILCFSYLLLCFLC